MGVLLGLVIVLGYWVAISVSLLVLWAIIHSAVLLARRVHAREAGPIAAPASVAHVAAMGCESCSCDDHDVNDAALQGAAASPGWYVDPHASDMLRWWDGEAWSETEFKLASTALPPKARRDLLLGPLGRLGSIVNIVFCAALLAGGVVGALTVHPMIWGGVAIGVVLEIVFITIAIVVRRFGVADRGQELIHRLERRHSPEETSSVKG